MAQNTGNSASPGGRAVGFDHVGYVVSDLQAAERFFVDVLGFDETDRRGDLADDGDLLTRLLGVHPRATATYVFVRIGSELVELMHWDAPDRSNQTPGNADAGGRHLALTIDGLDALLARVSAMPGYIVRERSDRGFVYLTTPFGLELQLIPA